MQAERKANKKNKPNLFNLIIFIIKRSYGFLSMKFLAVINPIENNLIHASIKYARDETAVVNVVASLFKDELVHFKFKGQFTVVGQ